MSDIAALIRDAKLPEKTVSVCLRPDLVVRYEDLDQQRADAQTREGDSLAGSGQARDLAEQMEVLRGEMTDSNVPFTFRAMPRAKFRALAEAHPPRKDGDGNVLIRDSAGVNDSTFPEALVRACLVDPDLDDALWAMLADKLTDRQYQALVDVSWTLNRAEVDVPFSVSASPPTLSFEPK